MHRRTLCKSSSLQNSVSSSITIFLWNRTRTQITIGKPGISHSRPQYIPVLDEGCQAHNRLCYRKHAENYSSFFRQLEITCGMQSSSLALSSATQMYWNQPSKRVTKMMRVQKQLGYKERLRVQNGEMEILLLSTRANSRK